MVGTLDFGSRGPGSSPGWVIVLCSRARPFTLTVLSSPRSINGYQQTVDEMLGVTCDGLASHPGGVAILLVASGMRDKLRRCGPLDSSGRLLDFCGKIKKKS